MLTRLESLLSLVLYKPFQKSVLPESPPKRPLTVLHSHEGAEQRMPFNDSQATKRRAV